MNDRLVDPGDPLPRLAGHSSDGRLERVLRSGRFAVTAELNPPDSADAREVYDSATPSMPSMPPAPTRICRASASAAY